VPRLLMELRTPCWWRRTRSQNQRSLFDRQDRDREKASGSGEGGGRERERCQYLAALIDDPTPCIATMASAAIKRRAAIERGLGKNKYFPAYSIDLFNELVSWLISDVQLRS